MSEHRRKPPQPQGGGRAAARKAAQQPSGRRAAPPSRGIAAGPQSGSYHQEGSYGHEPSYGGRAEARRAAQRGGGGGGRRGGGRGGPEGPGRGRGRGDGPQKKRLIDYPRSTKYGWQRFLPSWKQVAGLCVGFIGAVLAASSMAYAWVEIPQIHAAAKAQNNVYYWDDETQMVATGGEFNRQELAYKKIPDAMKHAVISAENKSFEKDPGVDPMGIMRAVVKMAMGGNTQGGSTITQQYVKNSRLSQEQTLTRKFTELLVSIKVGDELSKEEIMAGYLNVSYYGRGAYGLQAAAQAYFEKDAEDLNPSECAFLAAVLKGATYFDPAGAPAIDPEATAAKNKKRAVERWNWILNEQVKDGRLTQAERDKYPTFPDVKPIRKNANLSGQIGYLVDLAKANFINKNDQNITADKLSQGGYHIYTTFNKEKVNSLEKAVKNIYKKNIDPQKRPKYDTHVQFGGASVDPKNGKIVAVYGGDDATKHFTNNADQTGAQVGSTFKPFVLAAAMQYGKRNPAGGKEQSEDERTLISPKSIYNGDNKLKIKQYNGDVWRNEEGKEWLQTNDGQESYGPISLHKAMEVSANSPYVQLGMDVGIDKVRETAIDAGLLESSLTNWQNPSFSIGISDPSAIRMAGAYATFAASGKQNDPYSVTKVKRGGSVIWEHEAKPSNKIPANVADNVTDVLKNVVENGTGSNAQLPGREVAGKTGTTDGNRSAWFVGYTPQLSTAIDMYRLDDNAESKNREFLKMFNTGGQKKIHGSSFPSDIWHDYMLEALKGTEKMTFPVPEPIGKTVYGGGAKSPEPTPTEIPTTAPPTTAPPTTPPTTAPPTTPPVETPGGDDEECDPWDWKCKHDPGGANGGGADAGGGDIGGGETKTPFPPDGGNNGGQNGGGGAADGGGGNGPGGFLGGNDG
ncbi:transglycosylase domain-containing protein [Streptomyces candidus]|uniref:Membrane peptidoglycan carboxypeptidase n=1 Tax=Streptomyces candidus TaxID=67283 RepID=A0A7X0HJ14_9ACTN|nr:transglycosylase domain-containing protein [Streptomyces candidus]MBB6437287.1 membrane peptidoglycan carboxypeptidase [Streptomyces candidus]GHH38464.1 penicillin-binding protein [Streptomyces candidus]